MISECSHDFRGDLFGVRRCRLCRVAEDAVPETIDTKFGNIDNTWQERIAATPDATIRQRFNAFHKANPRVYDMIVRLSLQVKNQFGLQKCGVSLIYERMRWLHLQAGTSGEEPFKLSNDFRAEYARLIMLNEPGLQGFFNVRTLRRMDSARNNS